MTARDLLDRSSITSAWAALGGAGGSHRPTAYRRDKTAMNKAKWSRRRAANQPTKSKRVRYDHDNELAARVILEAPNRHASFLVDWARAFLRRRAEESRARRAPQHA